MLQPSAVGVAGNTAIPKSGRGCQPKGDRARYGCPDTATSDRQVAHAHQPSSPTRLKIEHPLYCIWAIGARSSATTPGSLGSRGECFRDLGDVTRDWCFGDIQHSAGAGVSESFPHASDHADEIDADRIRLSGLDDPTYSSTEG